MDSLEDCNLNWDSLLNLLSIADARTLALLSQTCKELAALASEDRYWHGCFGKVISIVPPDAQTWKSRIRDRQLYSSLEEAIDKSSEESEPATLILPPGRYDLTFACPPLLNIEGYYPNEFSDAEPQLESQGAEKSKEDSEASLDAKGDSTSSAVVLIYKGRGAFVYGQKSDGAIAPQTFRNFTFISGDHVFIYSVGLAILLEKITVIGACPIYVTSSELKARHCDFTKCSSMAIIAQSAARSANLHIFDCEFANCAAGALYFGAKSIATIEKCTFDNCGGSGAVDINAQTQISIRDSVISNTRGLSGIFAAHTSEGGNSESEGDSEMDQMDDEEENEEDDADLVPDEESDEDIAEFQMIQHADESDDNDDDDDDEEEDEEEQMILDSNDFSTPDEDQASAEPFKAQVTLENVTILNSRWNAVVLRNIPTRIHNCEIYRNGSIGIEVTETNDPKISFLSLTNTKIWDNAIDGVFAHQRASVVLGPGNKIHSNKGKGLYISADSWREISSDNEIINNSGGDLVVEPFVQSVAKPSGKEITQVIIDAIATGKCTYARTGPHYYVQKWYHCRTCKLVENEGCCEVCVNICHKGHDVDRRDINHSIFFCDCGASGACKALQKD